MPPFSVNMDSIDNSPIEAYSIKTDAGWNWNEMFTLRSNDQVICPYIEEVRYYEIRDKTATQDMMRQLNTSFVSWLQGKQKLVNYNMDGQLLNALPPVIT